MSLVSTFLGFNTHAMDWLGLINVHQCSIGTEITIVSTRLGLIMTILSKISKSKSV